MQSANVILLLLNLMYLTPEDIFALWQAIPDDDAQVEGKQIVAMTGLDLGELQNAGIITKGRWDSRYWRGMRWPDLPEPETSEERAERIEAKMQDYRHDNRNQEQD